MQFPTDQQVRVAYWQGQEAVLALFHRAAAAAQARAPESAHPSQPDNKQDHDLAKEPLEQFARLVNAAFKSYDSLLELANSPLAKSPLVTPALVLGEASPTTDERGRALRVALRWAVNRLSPTGRGCDAQAPRPFDDPAWQDPHWWRYHVLYHRYVKPFCPDELDDLGVDDITQALLALTGIPTRDMLYDIRDRAIREAAGLLQDQLARRAGDADLRALAVAEMLEPLRSQRAAWRLLEIAACFPTVLTRSLLEQLAAQEGINQTAAALRPLLDQRFLQTGDRGDKLWMPPALRDYVYVQQEPEARYRRHVAIASHCQEQPLEQAWHRQSAAQCANAPSARASLLAQAAKQVLEQAEALRRDDPERLLEILDRFPDKSIDQWCELQLLRCDLLRRAGQRNAALDAAARAREAARSPEQQARALYRSAKLHEDFDQKHALSLYDQAARLFSDRCPEWPALLKDRAWLRIRRCEWNKAKRDLSKALAALPADQPAQRADIYDALASLHRQQNQFARAVEYARQALALREDARDIQRIADSQNNLGLILSEMGSLDDALDAYRQARTAFDMLGNREAVATVTLNIGVAYHLAQRLHEAVEHYKDSYKQFREIELLPHPLATLCYNLAEALADQGKFSEAQRYWQQGYEISQREGLEDQLDFFDQLRRQIKRRARIDLAQPAASPVVMPAALDPIEQAALDMAQSARRVTPRDLMARAKTSRATATRKLQGLVGRGLLEMIKKGIYTPTPQATSNK